MLGSQSADEFLDRHWQKSPLFLKNAFATLTPELSSGDLAWLATQPDVESKLIFTDMTSAGIRYRVEHGPFEDTYLQSLPERDWTLLVQDVDKHLPAFRELVTSAEFVPDWRIDDLMISFAAPGGSVGPHSDNYDVFLCQGTGSRDWRLTEAGNATAAQVESDLALLSPFAGDPVYTAHYGDVLYLPPGTPHWGIAKEACLTYSIGMRAPDATEMKLAIERLYPDYELQIDEPGEVFYEDPDITTRESAPGYISPESLTRARRCFAFCGSLDDTELTRALGSVVTDPKAWLAPDALTVDAASSLVVHGMARLAWYDNGGIRMLFANGVDRLAEPVELEMFQAICAASRIQPLAIDLEAAPELRRWLLAHGVLDLDGAI